MNGKCVRRHHHRHRTWRSLADLGASGLAMMPVVATFDGIKIMFYNDEHPPPHFRAKYAEHEAMIDIEALDVLHGFLPTPQLRKTKAWADGRRQALLLAWLSCRSDLPPGKIA